MIDYLNKKPFVSIWWYTTVALLIISVFVTTWLHIVLCVLAQYLIFLIAFVISANKNEILDLKKENENLQLRVKLLESDIKNITIDKKK